MLEKVFVSKSISDLIIDYILIVCIIFVDELNFLFFYKYVLSLLIKRFHELLMSTLA